MCHSNLISVQSTLLLQHIFSVYLLVPETVLRAKDEVLTQGPPSQNLLTHRPICTRVTKGDPEWVTKVFLMQVVF